jgi:hypothetical protein
MKKVNNNPNKRHTLSQIEKIKRHLLKGKSLTPFEALVKFRCMRLASRINNLRNEPYYMNIQVRMKLLRSGKRVAEYRIAE